MPEAAPPYFGVPVTAIPGVAEPSATCALCGTVGTSIPLRSAHRLPHSRPEREGLFGCLSCLAAGRYTFFHITEAGYLFEDGLHNPTDTELLIPPHLHGIDPGRLELLRRTPRFPTWNEVEWPVHCHDFMVFLGEWSPPDFSRFGNGHSLFLQMTPIENHVVWPESGSAEWPIDCFTYWAFQCRHCGVYRGVCDLG